MIRVEGVTKSYGRGGTSVLAGIDFHLERGEFCGLIGPNGSGKSTLLALISGVDAPDRGTIRIDGKPVTRYSRRELARRLAVLLQDALPPVGFTVRQVIEMGRYPFQNWLGNDADPTADARLNAIMRRLNLLEMADRPIDRLSGGQRQRVALAKMMAQDPEILLLDEPTTFLDIGYQVQLMDYVRQWQREQQLTVIAVLHDLNLAAQYCDRLIVLHEGKIEADGKPAEVVTEERIARVYGTTPIVLPHPENQAPQVLLCSGDTAQTKT
jgi:iron complex transport system ATP-binding protein